MDDILTVRCYAQSTIFDNYMPHINKIVSKYSYLFDIKPAIKLDKHVEESDISILIIREPEKHTHFTYTKIINDINKHTKKRFLIIIFSEINQTIANKRKIEYKKNYPNSAVTYLDFEDWFPVNIDDYFNRHYKNLPMLDSAIINFMASIISNMYMY